MTQTKEPAAKHPRATKRRARNTVRPPEAFELGFADPGTAEWAVAWAGLAAVSGDEDREAWDPLSGEAWQYHGAIKRDGRWVHTFRHRWHPRMQKRWYLHVPASEGWKPPPRPEGESLH